MRYTNALYPRLEGSDVKYSRKKMINKEISKRIIQDLKSKALFFQNESNVQIIEKCSYIIGVGGLTVSTDETGNVITKNALYPTQFSKESVEKIKQLKFVNGMGRIVEPIIYGRNEWYKSNLDAINESLDLFRRMDVL